MCVQKRLDCMLKYENYSKPNSWRDWGGGEPKWPLNEHENIYFDNERDNHMSSRNYEDSGYGLNLDLLTSCMFHILGAVGYSESNHLRPI